MKALALTVLTYEDLLENDLPCPEAYLDECLEQEASLLPEELDRRAQESFQIELIAQLDFDQDLDEIA